MTTRELEPELLMRLGRVVTTWATVEALQSEFLAFLLKADPGATYAVSQTTASSTITGWLLTLCSVRSTDDAKMASLEEALREVNEPRVDRNALVHGVWATTTEPGTALVQTVRLLIGAALDHHVAGLKGNLALV